MVIAILAILASILFPVFASAKAAAKQSVCLSNMKQIGVASQLYLADYDDSMPEGDDYAEWVWLFLYSPYIKGKPADFTKPRDNVFYCPMVPASVPQYLSENRYDFLVDTGLDKVFGLTPTTDRDGERAFAFWSTYAINEHTVQEWPQLSSYADPAKTLMILEANDTEIEGDELRKLYGRKANCTPATSAEDQPTEGGHREGLNYVMMDTSAKFRKTVWSDRNVPVAQCDYRWHVFPQGGRGGSSTTASGSGRAECGEWTAPDDKLDDLGNCVQF